MSQKQRLSEYKIYKILGVNHNLPRYVHLRKDEKDTLRADILRLRSKYTRYGYRIITVLLRRDEGWNVNKKRAYSIWKEELLKVIKNIY